MKFTKDKKYEFLSYSKPFKVEFMPVNSEEKATKILRWKIDNFRGFSAYDSPRAEYKGRYVKCNYSLNLTYKTLIPETTYADGTKKDAFYNFLDISNEPFNFHTKKELKEYLNNCIEYMERGIEDYYYNQNGYKIIK